LFLEGKKFPSG
jgi:hypothetical protein